jgi:hypothetical protein
MLSQVSHIKYGSMYRDFSPQVGQRVDFLIREYIVLQAITKATVAKAKIQKIMCGP